MGALRLTKRQREMAEDHLAEHRAVQITPAELVRLTEEIGGGDFEWLEKNTGRPGRISLYGQAGNGRYYEVVVQVTSAYYVPAENRGYTAW